MRSDFADALESSDVKIIRDYINLFEFMWDRSHFDDGFVPMSAWDVIDGIFTPDFFGDTSVSLRDFDYRYGFDFPEPDDSVDLELLVFLCEYVTNLLERSIASQRLYSSFIPDFQSKLKLVDRIMDREGYRRASKKGWTIFVPRDVAADAAVEVLPDPISWQQLAYGHRSLRGDIEGKRALPLQPGHELEPRRQALKAVNPRLEARVFACLNRLDIRHDNRSEGANHNAALDCLSDAELEQLYDGVYRMLLVAFLELDGEDSFKRVSAAAGVK